MRTFSRSTSRMGPTKRECEGITETPHLEVNQLCVLYKIRIEQVVLGKSVQVRVCQCGATIEWQTSELMDICTWCETD